jgi:hypothetical protein
MMIMVFGNNLIDFSANGMVAAQVAYPAATSALQSTIGQDFIMPDLTPDVPPPTGDSTPRKILPLSISKTYTGLTFTVELDGDNYMGCGPQDSNGDDYNNGRACVAYPVDMSKSANETENEIKSKLLKFLKGLREQEEIQKAYEEAQAQWEQDKANCDSEVKEGSTFRFVNEDRNYSEHGPPTESWICQETIYPVKEEDTTETEDEEESTSDSVVVAQTTTPIETASTNLSIGFSEGFKRMAQRGIMVGGILLIGYGGVKFEERTNFFSKMFKGKKKTPKTNATPKTDTTPKTTEANA